MENIPISLTITTESIVAFLGVIVAIVIAVIGGIYAIITNTKKYELTENYRKELLDWYSSVSETMIKIIHNSETGEFFSNDFLSEKAKLLSRLSHLTEVGRFYFPNVIKNDDFGIEKPTAYQGYRHITLEFLLHFYQIASYNNGKKYIDMMWKLERHFTSVIFDMIQPRKRNREYSRYLALTIPEGQAIEDFLEANPNNIKLFYR